MKYTKSKISLILLFIILIFSGCDVYKSVDVGYINDVRFKRMADNKISLDLNVPISNPNNFKLKIKSIDFDVSVNGSYIGKMKNDSLIVVPKQFDGIQSFPVEIQLENLLSNAMMLYKLKKGKQVEVKVDGEIIVKAFLHKKRINVSEKQLVDIKEKLNKIGL